MAAGGSEGGAGAQLPLFNFAAGMEEEEEEVVVAVEEEEEEEVCYM